jgi:hypothetical protein
MSLSRSLDQSRNVREYEAAIQIDRYHTQVWEFGRERVVGDFRSGAGQTAEHGALAGVRHADQTYVSDAFEFQDESSYFARSTRRGLAWSLIGRRFEVRIPPATFATASHNDLIAVVDQIANLKAHFFIDDDGPWRDIENQIVATSAMAIRACAGGTMISPPMPLMGKGDERVHAGLGANDNTASVTAIPTAGASARNVFLTAKSHATIATSTGDHFYFDTVDKHRERSLRERKISRPTA